MLIDHAPSIRGLSETKRRSRRIIVLLLAIFFVALALFSFSCFNLHLFNDNKTIVNTQKISLPEAGVKNTKEIPHKPKTVKKSIPVSHGDTFMVLLVKAGIDRRDAFSIISSLSELFNPRQLRQGQEIILNFETPDTPAPMLFHSLSLVPDLTREIQVTRSPENKFSSKEILYELKKKTVKAKVIIKTSLYDAALDASMPMEVLFKMIRAYSYDVDFQRDIQPGDSFEALYEKVVDKNGNFIKGDELLYASLNTNGSPITIFRYEATDGEIDMYDSKGYSVRKTLMVTPIDGARLSSGYGMRRHPILGYTRMHKGLDFAAPSGTPIMAAGDGVIEFAGKKGGYGNYIRIRHANGYQTVYGHMKKFASGIKKGVRVKQGSIIGYVGSTGISTGPHLHYEVLYNKKNVNPASIKTPSGRILKNNELERFLRLKHEVETLCQNNNPEPLLNKSNNLQVFNR
ncbi:MAG: M23 family metallopeptidase [Deltaproteobacteria bacterium]|nr:M23 family metallopeptidase [Deltaproteobacteria bacterium]